MEPQLTSADLWTKIIGFGLTIALFAIYLIIRFTRWGWRFLSSGQQDEQKLINSKEASLNDLQGGPWLANTEMTINYASFGLNVIILAVVFIFEQRLNGIEAVMFDLLLAFTGISAMSFFLSLQWWFIALDKGGSVEYRLRFRKQATIFQTIGWISLLSAGAYSILIISKFIGFIFCFVMLAGLIYIFEYKFRSSLNEEFKSISKEIDFTDFQRSFTVPTTHAYDALLTETRITPEAERLRVMTWNIERGYDPQRITEVIQSVDADFVCLQEVDMYNHRTGDRNVLKELSIATGTIGYYANEFMELDVPYRKGKLGGGGVHGNAVLSRYYMDRGRYFELPECFDWKTKTTPSLLADRREKRFGGRSALVCQYKWGEGKLIISSTHFEDKSGGVAGRQSQFKSIIDQTIELWGEGIPMIIAGDFNTFESRLTRMMGITHKSESAGKPAGMSECEWWKENILPRYGFSDPFSCCEWTRRQGPVKFKLDWICVRGLKVVDHGLVRTDVSDHDLLWLDFERG